jgi:hypothetical protein
MSDADRMNLLQLDSLEMRRLRLGLLFAHKILFELVGVICLYVMNNL